MRLSSRRPPLVLTNLLSFRWPRALQILPSLLCGQRSPGSLGFGHTQLQTHQMYPRLTNCRFLVLLSGTLLPRISAWLVPRHISGLSLNTTPSARTPRLPLAHYPLNSSFFITAPCSLWSYLLSCISLSPSLDPQLHISRDLTSHHHCHTPQQGDPGLLIPLLNPDFPHF